MVSKPPAWDEYIAARPEAAAALAIATVARAVASTEKAKTIASRCDVTAAAAAPTAPAARAAKATYAAAAAAAFTPTHFARSGDARWFWRYVNRELGFWYFPIVKSKSIPCFFWIRTSSAPLFS
jgi:hypothetical protein